MTPSERWSSRAWDWWAANFLLVEFVAAALVGVSFRLWVAYFGGGSAISDDLYQNWSTFFSTLASLFGALFGFVVTANAIIVALVSDKVMKLFREGKRVHQLWDSFLQTNATLGIGASLSVIGLVFSRSDSVRLPLTCILFFIGVLASVRLVRILWLLDSLPRLRDRLSSKAEAETGGS